MESNPLLYGGSLNRNVKIAYGVGHVFNDLCASMWFTYLLVYLQYVIQLDRGTSGSLLLLGQVTDAISTPIIGYMSDGSLGSSCWNYGRRKTWHLIGTIVVIISFPFIFIMCVSCVQNWIGGYTILIGLMIIGFQFGWSSVQVSHLALIPDLTPNELERDELNVIRYFFDMMSDVLVYLAVFITFTYTASNETDLIGPDDHITFTVVTIVIVIVGGTCSTIFHVFTKETTHRTKESKIISKNNSETSSIDSGPETEGKSSNISIPPVLMTWQDWFSEPQFYQVCLIYTSSRLVSNLVNIYMPIYLQETARASQSMTALIPLVISTSGIAASIFTRYSRKCVGKKIVMCISIGLGFLGSIFLIIEDIPYWGLYMISITYGFTGSVMIIISLAFTSDLIGYSTNSSAFVYGVMSFWDKVLNGLVVFIIQKMARYACDNNNCATYYRMIVSIGIMIPLFLGVLGMLSIASLKLGLTRKIEAGSSTSNSEEIYQVSNSSQSLLEGSQNSKKYTEDVTL